MDYDLSYKQLTINYPDGKIEQGEFQDDLLVDKKIIFPDGEIYESKFENGLLIYCPYLSRQKN